MVRFFCIICNSPRVSVIVWLPRTPAKLMVSLATALLTANLSVPAALMSAVLVTFQLKASTGLQIRNNADTAAALMAYRRNGLGIFIVTLVWRLDSFSLDR